MIVLSGRFTIIRRVVGYDTNFGVGLLEELRLLEHSTVGGTSLENARRNDCKLLPTNDTLILT